MVTEEFVERILQIKEDMIGEEIYDKAQYHVLDYLGVLFGSGNSDAQNEKIYRMVSHVAKEGGSQLIGKNKSFSPPFAAFYNAAVNHTIELDDTNSEASLHPSSVIISTALACGQSSNCSGRKVLYAIIVGYELMIRLGKALDPARHYAQGFHPTATCGVFGSAITASLLMGLNDNQIKHAIGLAGSYASGNCKYQTEATVAKRLQPAIAAQNGILAAIGAYEGLEGPQTIFDEYNGFLHSHSPEVRIEHLFDQLGMDFQIMKTGLKFYPCCRYIHGAIDGILKLIHIHMLKHSQIRRVKIEVTSAAMSIVVEPAAVKRNPHNLFDKQFSLFYCAAVAMANGEMPFDVFENDRAARITIFEQINKIEIVPNKSLDLMYPERWPTIVSLWTDDPEPHKIRIDSCLGEPDNCDISDIENKYMMLTRKSINTETAVKIKENVFNLKQDNDIKGLMACL